MLAPTSWSKTLQPSRQMHFTLNEILRPQFILLTVTNCSRTLQPPNQNTPIIKLWVSHQKQLLRLIQPSGWLAPPRWPRPPCPATAENLPAESRAAGMPSSGRNPPSRRLAAPSMTWLPTDAPLFATDARSHPQLFRVHGFLLLKHGDVFSGRDPLALLLRLYDPVVQGDNTAVSNMQSKIQASYRLKRKEENGQDGDFLGGRPLAMHGNLRQHMHVCGQHSGSQLASEPAKRAEQALRVRCVRHDRQQGDGNAQNLERLPRRITTRSPPAQHVNADAARQFAAGRMMMKE
jgi:hypothetical protein